MNKIHDHITPARLHYLRELYQMVQGEPYVRGPTRNHLLKLGWIQGVYEMPDGSKICEQEFDRVRPRGTMDRWDGVKFFGVTLTERGRQRLDDAERGAA